MFINENWHGEGVDTKIYNWKTANNPLSIKPINEDTVVKYKMGKEELEKYIQRLEHKEINRVKGEQQ